MFAGGAIVFAEATVSLSLDESLLQAAKDKAANVKAKSFFILFVLKQM